MNSAVTSMPSRAAEGDVRELMQQMGRDAVSACERLALASSATKDRALTAAAAAVRAQAAAILAANAEDMREAQASALGAAMLDRLQLDDRRVEAVARGLDEIVALPDPVGGVIAAWTRPNGLRISRVRVPLGVIGIIYESRPNVTADAGALGVLENILTSAGFEVHRVTFSEPGTADIDNLYARIGDSAPHISLSSKHCG